MTGTAKTTRLRRLDCDAGCGYTVRTSRRWLDAGLPVCPCGGLLVPAALEDAERAHAAGHLTDAQLQAHPEAITFAAQSNSVAHGQAGPGRARIRTSETALRSPDAVALERVYRERATIAAANRLGALRDHAFGASTDEIPF